MLVVVLELELKINILKYYVPDLLRANKSSSLNFDPIMTGCIFSLTALRTTATMLHGWCASLQTQPASLGIKCLRVQPSFSPK